MSKSTCPISYINSKLYSSTSTVISCYMPYFGSVTKSTFAITFHVQYFTASVLNRQCLNKRFHTLGKYVGLTYRNIQATCHNSRDGNLENKSVRIFKILKMYT